MRAFEDATTTTTKKKKRVKGTSNYIYKTGKTRNKQKLRGNKRQSNRNNV